MIKIIETPRDAMQGIQNFIPTANKIKFINSLFKIGYHSVDVGSFVSPKAIPQMADTALVLNSLDLSDSQSKVMVTIGNLRGGLMAMDFPFINEIAFPYSVSEEFLKRNINSDKRKVLKTIEELLTLCQKNGKELILYNSMAFGNAYGEEWSPEIVVDDLQILSKMGVNTVILSDTVDLGEPEAIRSTFKAVSEAYPQMELGAHLHTNDTDWFEHVEAAWESGCRRFDAVINGLGGCPMSGKKLVGNLPTSNLLTFLQAKKVDFGIDSDAFNQAALLGSMLIHS